MRLDREWWDGVRAKSFRRAEVERALSSELVERKRDGGGRGSSPGDPTAAAALYDMGRSAELRDELASLDADIGDAVGVLEDFCRCDVPQSVDKAVAMALHYVDRMTWVGVAGTIGCHPKTAQALRDRAIADMLAMGEARIREHGSNPQKAV